MLSLSSLIKFLIVLIAEGITFIAIGTREITKSANFGSIIISLLVFEINLSFNSFPCATICSFVCLFDKIPDVVIP